MWYIMKKGKKNQQQACNNLGHNIIRRYRFFTCIARATQQQKGHDRYIVIPRNPYCTFCTHRSSGAWELFCVYTPNQWHNKTAKNTPNNKEKAVNYNNTIHKISIIYISITQIFFIKKHPNWMFFCKISKFLLLIS